MTMTLAPPQTFVEAKSRHITPAMSVFDFQKGDGLLIKTGNTVVHKLVTDMDIEAGTVTATDPSGQGSVTVKLDPNNPVKDGTEFKYWIDESGDNMPQQTISEIVGDDLDDLDNLDDPVDALNDFGDDDDDLGLGAAGLEFESGFDEDLRDFLGETSAVTTQIPDVSVAGGVDDNDQSGNDGEDPENTPPPHDSTGLENPGDVSTLAGAGSSNTGGSSPTDQVSTNNSVGGPPQNPGPVTPSKGEHEPGVPDTHESIVADVDTALKLVGRGADPTQLSSRLLRGV